MAIQTWQLILEGPNAAAYNMAADEALLSQTCSEKARPLTYVRFFQWSRPTLSLGFSQQAARTVDFTFCRENGIELVRRLTGGKAVLHHKELTYSIVSNDASFFPLGDISETYRSIANALVLGFRYLGIETSLAEEGRPENPLPRQQATSACFAVSNHHEILCSGRKLVGSAQRRTKSAFLQHGSILLEFDPSLLAGALGQRDSVALAERVTSLRECLGDRIGPDEVSSNLQRGVRESFGVNLERVSLSLNQRKLVEHLASTKYGRLDWSTPSHPTAKVSVANS